VPEGDTLRRLATRINDRVAGQVVGRSVMRDPRVATVDLAGRTLSEADAYGKHLFVRFDDGRTLHAHLMMSGSFEIGRASRRPEWRRRVELWLGNGRLTGIDVPVLDMIATGDEHEITDRLGPDLCAIAGPPDVDAIVTRMMMTPDEPLGGAMLDQRNVAGFGNIYANDVPFIAGLSPMQPVGAIDGLERVLRVATALIRVNARRGPQNTTGRRIDTDDRWMHGAGRSMCPVCGERLDYRAGEVSPWGRSVTWCPTCQPLRDRALVDVERIRRLIALHPALREPYVDLAS
jgi:endonuclease VIII